MYNSRDESGGMKHQRGPPVCTNAIYKYTVLLQQRICKWSLRLSALKINKPIIGRAMAQAVSCCSITAKAWVRARSIYVGFVVDKVTLGQVLSPSSLVFLCQYSIVAVHTHISSGGSTIGPLVAAIQRHSLTPST
jgi:hypothetical protein